jgi:hypothetical protein
MRPPACRPRVSLALFLAVFFAVQGAALAQGTSVDPASVVGGDSSCPTPTLVWQRLEPLVPNQVLVDRLRSPGGPTPPVQIVDLGPSFRVVIAGSRLREYTDEGRDCAKRAQFAAVFVAVAAGAETASTSTSPVAPAQVVTVRAVPAEVSAAPAVARIRLDLGATAGAGLGGGEPTIAPGLALRIGFGSGRVIPVAALTLLGPVAGDVSGIGIRQWQAMADVDVRASFRAVGRSLVYVEVGAAVELLSDRPTNLALARTQISYAVGPRAAVGVRLATRGRLSPFFLIHAAWFPYAPELFALPAGDLGRAAPWNVGATAGASWGLL